MVEWWVHPDGLEFESRRGYLSHCDYVIHVSKNLDTQLLHVYRFTQPCRPSGLRAGKNEEQRRAVATTDTSLRSLALITELAAQAGGRLPKWEISIQPI